mmetsp:Transcript_108367/g.305581  ORF Transcript_108367/g.305581 Transcript_108367/m.305581 type:complete len:255 (-) Transcript_108367:104-868(-)
MDAGVVALSPLQSAAEGAGSGPISDDDVSDSELLAACWNMEARTALPAPGSLRGGNDEPFGLLRPLSNDGSCNSNVQRVAAAELKPMLGSCHAANAAPLMPDIGGSVEAAGPVETVAPIEDVAGGEGATPSGPAASAAASGHTANASNAAIEPCDGRSRRKRTKTGLTRGKESPAEAGKERRGCASAEEAEAPPKEAATSGSALECGICMDAKADTAFDPCGHMVCGSCCKLFVKKPCPVCRKKVKKTLRLFLP